jgi:antitoxin HicB
MGQQYTVSDSRMMLILEEADEGGFVVTSPLDPGLVTQAETLQEAFRMAQDAAECLAIGRKRLAERLGLTDPSSPEPGGKSTSPGPVRAGRSSAGQAGKKPKRALNS